MFFSHRKWCLVFGCNGFFVVVFLGGTHVTVFFRRGYASMLVAMIPTTDPSRGSFSILPPTLIGENTSISSPPYEKMPVILGTCFCCFQTWQLRTSIDHSKCFMWRRNPWDFRENRYTYTYKPCFKWAKRKKPPSTGAHRIKSAIHSTWWLMELVVRTLGFSPQLTPIGWFN